MTPEASVRAASAPAARLRPRPRGRFSTLFGTRAQTLWGCQLSCHVNLAIQPRGTKMKLLQLGRLNPEHCPVRVLSLNLEQDQL